MFNRILIDYSIYTRLIEIVSNNKHRVDFYYKMYYTEPNETKQPLITPQIDYL